MKRLLGNDEISSVVEQYGYLIDATLEYSNIETLLDATTKAMSAAITVGLAQSAVDIVEAHTGQIATTGMIIQLWAVWAAVNDELPIGLEDYRLLVGEEVINVNEIQ